MSHDNYLYRKNQLMKTFDKLLARVQPGCKPFVVADIGKMLKIAGG